MNTNIEIKKNISLSSHTTFRVGGKARYYTEIKSKEDLSQAINWSRNKKQKILFFAGGSNVLINDRDIDGLVIKIANKKVIRKGERLECEAGTDFSQVIRVSISNSLTGLEWAMGIPGSIGGAIRGNAGAYGGCIGDNVETVEVFDLKANRFILFSKKDCDFQYRDSIFKKNKNFIIWQITLRLKKGIQDDIKILLDKIIRQRNKSQPKLPSAGCVFKNILFDDLVNSNSYFANLAKEKKVVKGGKVGTGWLIKQIIEPGKKIGDAKVSLEHANFIVNTRKAKAEDIIILISYIKQQVRDKIGIQLQEEIEYFGF
jgi:UDP-N-acetylmuramate dehydrogenase